MERDESIIIKGLAILLIAAYHFQAAVSENAVLSQGEGLISWLKATLFSGQLKMIISGGLWISFLGVNVFFVLSGYGLTKKFMGLKDLSWTTSYKQMLKQIKKIYIPYFWAHPLVHVMVGLVWILVWQKSLSFNQWLSFYPLKNYVLSLLIVPRWFGNDLMFIFNGTWWFVGVIVEFYLLFPLLIWLKKKLGNNYFLILILGITISYRWILIKLGLLGPIGSVYTNETFYWVNFPARLAEFGLGMWLAGNDKVWKKLKKTGWVILGLGWFLSLYKWGWVVNDFVLGLGGFLMLSSVADKVRKNKIIAYVLGWIGKYSYYIYLLHEPVLGLIIRGY